MDSYQKIEALLGGVGKDILAKLWYIFKKISWKH